MQKTCCIIMMVFGKGDRGKWEKEREGLGKVVDHTSQLVRVVLVACVVFKC